MTTDYIKEIENSNVYDIAVKTPVTRLQKISDKFKNNIFLKREDMQSIFSFKCRGSYNKISNLEEEKK
ncbi:MAG: pyridoxal-phosphate dependent enzyme, partial [Pseudomonadota bacterium]|nr:pyridoxal-phosphate dependent enzyme [Pseudomonadota bacterium]